MTTSRAALKFSSDMSKAASLYAGLPQRVQESVAHTFARLEALDQAADERAARRANLKLIWSRP